MSLEHSLRVLFDKADQALRLLGEIHRKVDSLMAVSQELKDLAAKIDAATNAVATRIDALSQRVTNGMSDQEVADVKAGFQAEVDRLTALGRDPNNPVPASPK